MSASPQVIDGQIPLRPLTRQKRLVLHEPDGSKPLTRRQQLFVEFYRRGYNPKKAAIAAGYSPFSAECAATEILQNPRVQEEIARRDNDYFDSIGLDDPNSTIKKIVLIRDANIADFIDIEEDGTFKVNLSNVSRDMLYAVKSLSYDPEGRPKIEMESRSKAQDTLLKLYLMKLDGQHGQSGHLTIQALDSIVQKVTNIQINIQGHNQRSDSNAVASAGQLPVSVGDPIANN